MSDDNEIMGGVDDAFRLMMEMEEEDKRWIEMLRVIEREEEEDRRRQKKTLFIRIDWEYHVEQLRHTDEFQKRYHMTEASFNKLLDMLREYIEMNKKQSSCSSRGNVPIIPEVVLASGLRFLGGVGFAELADIFGHLTSSLRRTVNRFLTAVNCCPRLLIKLPLTSDELKNHVDQWDNLSSAFGLFHGVVGAIDGWLACTNKPSSRDVTNQTDFFSGHYQRYGLNVQAVCDSNLRFIYLSINSPGKTNDAIAFQRCDSLQEWLDKLPEQYFLIGDNAYQLNSTMLVPFQGSQKRNDINRSFNFYLSQLRIRVKMAFGQMTTKWRIFRKNLDFSLHKNTIIIEVAAKLHNYVIESDGVHFDCSFGEMSIEDFGVETLQLGSLENNGYLPSSLDKDAQKELDQKRRNNIVDEIRERQLLRPDYNVIRNNDANL